MLPETGVAAGVIVVVVVVGVDTRGVHTNTRIYNSNNNHVQSNFFA